MLENTDNKLFLGQFYIDQKTIEILKDGDE